RQLRLQVASDRLELLVLGLELLGAGPSLRRSGSDGQREVPGHRLEPEQAFPSLEVGLDLERLGADLRIEGVGVAVAGGQGHPVAVLAHDGVERGPDPLQPAILLGLRHGPPLAPADPLQGTTRSAAGEARGSGVTPVRARRGPGTAAGSGRLAAAARGAAGSRGSGDSSVRALARRRRSRTWVDRRRPAPRSGGFPPYAASGAPAGRGGGSR